MGKRTLLFDGCVESDSDIFIPAVEVLTQLGFRFKYLGYKDSKPGYYTNDKLVIKREHQYEINGNYGTYEIKSILHSPYESEYDSWMGLVIDRKVKAIPKGMGRIFADNANELQLPLLVLCDFLGYKTDWNANKKQVTVHLNRGDVTFEMGNKVVTTYDGEKILPYAPMEKENLPYIPVEAVKEIFDIRYEMRRWNDMYTTTWVGDRDIIRYYFDRYLLLNLDPNQLGNNVVDYSHLPKGYMLADNKEFVDYIENNYGELDYYGNKKYIINGLNQGMEDSFCSGRIFAYSNTLPSDPMMDYIQVYDDTHRYGYYRIDIRYFTEVKDIFKYLLTIFAGDTDGQHIYDYYVKGRTTSVTINEWIKLDSGRQFMIRTKEDGKPIRGNSILIKKSTHNKDFENPLYTNKNFVSFMQKNYPKKYHITESTVIDEEAYKKAEFVYDPSGKFFQEGKYGYIEASTQAYRDYNNAMSRNRLERTWNIVVYKFDDATRPIVNEMLKTLFGEEDANSIMSTYDYKIKNNIEGVPYNYEERNHRTPSDKKYAVTYYNDTSSSISIYISYYEE